MNAIQLPEKHITLFIVVMGFFTLNNLYFYMNETVYILCNILIAISMLFLFIRSFVYKESKSKGMGKWNWFFMLVMIFVFTASIYEVVIKIS